MRIASSVVVLAVLVAGSAYAVYASLGDSPVDRYRNALEETRMVGDEAGDFALTDVGGVLRSLSQWRGKGATVLYFWSIDCPCVDACEMRVKRLMDRFRDRDVSWVAIDSHPDDTREAVLRKMVRLHADYRMFLDPTGKIAKRLGGLTATDAVVLDGEGRIRYRGAIDDALVKPKEEYLGPALEAILAGRDPVPAETKPYGCPFPGNEGICEILGR